MKILAITQARIGSSRFPAKILKEINGESLLELHLNRILKSKLISKLKVATTTELDAIKIVEICNRLSIETYRGSVENVLERFYLTALPEKPDWVVRLTSDCPLIDPEVIDKVILHATTNNCDYVSNTLKPTFPDGIDVEVFKFSSLEKAMKEAQLLSEKEHVTSFIWKNSSYLGNSIFSSDCVKNDIDYSDFRLTVDTIEDYNLLKKLIEELGPDKHWIDYVNFLKENDEIKKINSNSIRNEGYKKSMSNDKT